MQARCRILTVAGLVAILLVGFILFQVLYVPERVPTPAEVLARGEAVPFQVCLQNPTWTRPAEEEQRKRVWQDPRYAGEEALKTHPRWQENFLLYSGGARDEGLLIEWGGFWKEQGRIERSTADLCRERQYTVSVGQQVEIWLKYHHVLQVQRLGKTFVLVVEPHAQGFEAINFNRTAAEPLVFIFVAPDGKELRRITLRLTPAWDEKYLPYLQVSATFTTLV